MRWKEALTEVIEERWGSDERGVGGCCAVDGRDLGEAQAAVRGRARAYGYSCTTSYDVGHRKTPPGAASTNGWISKARRAPAS